MPLLPQKVVFIAVFLAFSLSLKATHIVGGEMYYTCLGNNQYEITLTIFRDCYSGVPWFDDPASIGIFDGQNYQLLSNVLVPLDFNLNDTLDPILSSECFVAPPDVCVHTTTYTTIVTLPPNPNGYYLSYQRCCRNATITNIVDPLDTGATFGVFITSKALNECNSNPQFNSWPPLYICVNEPISFDQSAFDIDGDSIVYKLCTPLNGATPDDPMPQPPNAPPYLPITFIDPPYNEANMLNGMPGGVPLTIDPATGLLTGIPNTIGQFVVGICVEEYRDGELISTTRRDFQYNVGVCGETTASFFAPEVVCESLTVFFDNQSFNADNFEWYFNDPAVPGLASTVANPIFTFSDYGTYEVMMIAEPNSICADTFIQSILLTPNSLLPDFAFEILECSDSLVVQVTDLTIDTVSNPVSWYWQTSTGLTSEDQNPVFIFYEDESLVVNLIVTSENGCANGVAQPFIADLIEESLPLEMVICPGDSTFLNPIFSDEYDFVWSPATGLDDPSSPNPLAFPSETTVYSVAITDAPNCQVEREITVFVPDPIELDLPADTTTCDPEFLLYANSPQAVEYFWANDPDFNDVFSFDSAVWVTPLGPNIYYILVRDEYGCARFDSVQVTGNGVNLDLAPQAVVCLGESVQVFAQNIDPDDLLSFDWSPDSLITAFDFTPTPIFTPVEAGSFWATCEIVNQLDCSLIDSIEIVAIDTADLENSTFSVQCSGYTVQFENNSVNGPFLLWTFGDPANPMAFAEGAQVSYTYPGPGTYTVNLYLPINFGCPDTLTFQVPVGQPAIEVDFVWELLTCADTALIQFNNLSENNQSDITGVQWIFSNGLTTADAAPSFVIDQSQDLTATLVLTSSDGCVDSLQQTVSINLIEVDLADSLFICPGAGVFLNPGFNPDYNYLWSPALGLDNPQSPNPFATPGASQVYTVQVSQSAPDSCVIYRTVPVWVAPTIELETAGDLVTCEPDTLLTASSPQAVSWVWSDQPDLMPVLSTANTLLAELDRFSAFYVLATDSFGCSRLDTILAYNLTPEVALSGQVVVCAGDTAALSLENLAPGDELSVVWSPQTYILADDGAGNILILPDSNQVYTYTATNQFGCSVSGTVQVIVNEVLPVISASAVPDTILIGESAQLTATFDDDYSYAWQPAESLSDPFIHNPLATPSQTTDYTVTAVNSFGCETVVTVRVVVIDPICEDPFIFIPTGFSPNGDGVNDLFTVRGNYIEEIYLAVYDRWGEKVFETTTLGAGWDGTFRGRALSPDVYGFYAEVRCIGGAEYIKKGNLTLIR